MSAGHRHKRANDKHPTELKKLLKEPTAAAMMAHPPRIVSNFDTPYTGGYPVMGNWRYLDPVFVQAVRSGRIHIPGMTPDDIIRAVWLHEFIERVILDADNDVETYQDAHEFATCGEHLFVRSKAEPYVYERAIKPTIIQVMRKPIVNVRKDFCCAPMRDHEDPEDARILAKMTQLGVIDATKAEKESPAVSYGRATGKDNCVGCANWQGPRQINPDATVPFANLAPCAKVEGAVRTIMWCKLYEEAGNGQAQGDDPQQSSQQQLRPAGGAQVPDA